MPDVPCFLITKTDRVRRKLRRYFSAPDWKQQICPIHGSMHNASAIVDVVPDTDQASGDSWPHDDPRWPKVCDCGQYNFTEQDHWQLFIEHLFRRDTGEEHTLREAPPGAMWYADWMIEGVDQSKHGNLYRGPDGHCLMVRCPDGHDWCVDSRCSNCTLPNDNIHKCWVRHGTPPNITVDKNGVTCAAGAGSILTPKWHGFLTSGVLSEHR